MRSNRFIGGSSPRVVVLVRATGEPAAGRVWLLPGLVAGVLVLGAVALVSLAVGAEPVPLPTVVDSLLHYDRADGDQLIVQATRVPRTVLGIVVGAALGTAGAVMQGLTRNPLADPGLLGVTAGAALAVAIGISVFGVASPSGHVWFGFAGAALAVLVVSSVGARGRAGATPVKLALAGAVLSAALSAVTAAILLADTDAVDEFRLWSVGSLAGRGEQAVLQTLPFVAVGIGLAMVCGRLLNALALGDNLARALGQDVAGARGFCALCVVVLCGAATATAGPIGFIGLTVPHAARAITGPDHRWILPYSMVLAPILLLTADVLGRVVAHPTEIQVGIVTAVIGAPYFVARIRRRDRAADLRTARAAAPPAAGGPVTTRAGDLVRAVRPREHRRLLAVSGAPLVVPVGRHRANGRAGAAAPSPDPPPPALPSPDAPVPGAASRGGPQHDRAKG